MNLKLKELRKAHGMRQEDLAAAILSTPRIVGAWERGETPLPLEDACLIADVFGCTLDELAGRNFPASQNLRAGEQQLIDSYRNMDSEYQAMLRKSAVAYEAMTEKDGAGSSEHVGLTVGVAI